MNIEYKRIDNIKPYESNPRVNDGAVDAVSESIKSYGFRQPIVIDKEGVIIVGHTRYKAAKKLKLKSVPCIVAEDLTAEEVKAYRLADNKTHELSCWNFDLLNDELSELSDIGLDMGRFGFCVDASDSFIEELEKESPELYKEAPLQEFSVTLVFPIEHEQSVKELIESKGKGHLVNLILDESKRYA